MAQKSSLILVVVIAAVLICIGARHQLPAHPVEFYDEGLFFQGVSRYPLTHERKSMVTGGIVPHHLLATTLIAQFFSRIKPPKTIILIGPNHPELGAHRILTSRYAWDTPFGAVYPDRALLDTFLESGQVYVDESILVHEHSVAGLMPYIKYYLPQTRVVPLILSHELSGEELDAFSKLLADQLSDQTMLIASVDFSHYLAGNVAEQKDKETLAAIQSYDYATLGRFQSDHMDSPPSIIALLRAMQTTGADDIRLLQHTNSSKLQNIDYNSTTSYFTLYFSK